jgi:hypothetical protein
MQRSVSILALAVMTAAAACGRGANNAADTSLNTDLSLAAQQRGFQPFDSLGAAERAAGGAAVSGAPLATPAHSTQRVSSGDVSRTRRTASSGASRTTSGTTRSSGGTIEKHTKRDAAIGAAAGAVIGATTSRNKVKGGLIGAAIGGILGGVIGNNVDKKKKP